MSATSSSSDKYLFLFTTTENDDLTPVKSALQDYYKYPAAADHTFEAKGRANFAPVYKTLVEKLCGTDPANPVYPELDPDGIIPPGEEEAEKKNTLVVVISGNSDAAATGLKDADGGVLLWDTIRLVIQGTIGPKSYPYQDQTEVNIIFVSPDSDSFVAAFDTNVPIVTGTLIARKTVLDDQTSRNAFLTSLGDELKLTTATGLDQHGRISFNNIAGSLLGTSVATCFRSIPDSSSLYFPGYAWFEISDSDPVGASSDISIGHPSMTGVSGSQYLYDSGGSFRNIINVHTVVRGTHPVKSLCINLGIYRNSEVVEVDEPSLKAANTLSGLWKPGDTITPDPVAFNTVQFGRTDYNCLVARATAAGDDIFASIDPGEHGYEAQLNILMYEEDLICTVTHTDATSTSANDGHISIVATGGAPFQLPAAPYEYNIDSGSWGQNGQFSGLS
ncbi:MAG TPA: hypothetical protein PKI12_07065, partial [Bacteroidales bacterium]|nr:hypothetical protein [Bacteroidales bacterium]